MKAAAVRFSAISSFISRVGIFLVAFGCFFALSSPAMAEKSAPKNGAHPNASLSALKKSMSPSFTIPLMFLGQWAIESDHCREDVDYDDAIKIESNSISGYETGCTISKGISSGNEFSGKFLCNESGEEYAQFRSFKINDNGMLTISYESDGNVTSQKYFRCKSSNK